MLFRPFRIPEVSTNRTVTYDIDEFVKMKQKSSNFRFQISAKSPAGILVAKYDRLTWTTITAISMRDLTYLLFLMKLQMEMD